MNTHRPTTFARLGCIAAVGALLVILTPTLASAAPGSLDPLFDTDGKLMVGLAPGDADDDFDSLAVQPDGKIVIGGTADMGVLGGGEQFSVVRYNTDGSLDPSFDFDGKLTLGIAPVDSQDRIGGLAIQPDGKIVLFGNSQMGAGLGGFDFSAARINSDGSLDPGFGTGGKTTFAIAPGDATDIPGATAILPDGKIVVGGNSIMGAGLGGSEFAVARLNANGSLDMTFDADGKQTTGIASGDGDDVLVTLAIGLDGKIVGGGWSTMGAGLGGNQFSLARFNTNGSLDTTFDTDGKQTTGSAPSDEDDGINAVVIQPDGKIVAGGRSQLGAGAGDYQFSLSRYNSNGSLDGSFDFDGQLTMGIASGDNQDFVNALALQADGKIVAGGRAVMGSGLGGSEYAVARYNADGSLDTSFSVDGTQTTGIAPADDSDSIWGLAIQPDGKIVAGGQSISSTVGAGGRQLSLARYLGAPIPDTAITAGPAEGSVVTTTAPTFEFTSIPQGATFQCSIDGGAYAPCTSSHTMTTLANGAHSFAVRATDSVGDPDPTPAVRNFAVVMPKPATPEADSNINTLKKKIKAKKLRLFKGTATNAAKVQIALLKLSPGVKAAATKGKKKRSCRWLKSSRAKFKSIKPSKKRTCNKQVWLKATGSAKWLFKLKKRLPKGRYVLYSRAIGADGKAETSFTAADKNRVAFKIV